MTDIYIHAEIQCASQSIAEVRSILTELQSQTLQEQGCVFYKILEDKSQVGFFATMEHWADETAETRHWETPHLKNAVDKLELHLTKEMRLSKYRSVV